MFTILKNRRTQARKEQIEGLANSCQFELYNTLAPALRKEYDTDLANRIAAGLANHIVQFGHKSVAHAQDSALLELVQAELERCHNLVGSKFQQNVLGCMILLASVWNIPLETFKAHIQSLHAMGLFKLGPDTPNVSRDLPSDGLIYMYELTTME